MNLLTDPLLTLSNGSKVSLPALFAAMAKADVRGFPALRPHQRPAWHMFLVQLGALAFWGAKREDPPVDAADWRADLRRLTPDHPDDAPWRLVVKERDKPAFLQPPDPGGLRWAEVSTPDALDLLITSRNHDLKQSVARQANEEDWIFSLVSLQTSEGFGGRGNYGIARMNGGSSSRPMMGLAPSRHLDTSVDFSAWWARDVRRLTKARDAGQEIGIGRAGGLALLWCLDWTEGGQLDLRDLDPWFIEICRRVRLIDAGGVVSALRSGSKAARIDAKAFKGNVGDPWAPVHATEGKAFTLGSGDFGYRQLCGLLFSGNWKVPLLARTESDETSDLLLVAEALSRGNCKTEGFKSRIVPVPGKVVPLLSSDTAATLSTAQMDEIRAFDSALRYALQLVASNGEYDAVKKHSRSQDHCKDPARPACARFQRAADQRFFPSLWRRFSASSHGENAAFEAKQAFLKDLMSIAEAELDSALPTISCAAIRRPKAEARARRAFQWKLRSSDACRELFRQGDTDVAA